MGENSLTDFGLGAQRIEFCVRSFTWKMTIKFICSMLWPWNCVPVLQVQNFQEILQGRITVFDGQVGMCRYGMWRWVCRKYKNFLLFVSLCALAVTTLHWRKDCCTLGAKLPNWFLAWEKKLHRVLNLIYMSSILGYIKCRYIILLRYDTYHLSHRSNSIEQGIDEMQYKHSEITWAVLQLETWRWSSVNQWPENLVQRPSFSKFIVFYVQNSILTHSI